MAEILSQKELDALLSGVRRTVKGEGKKIKRYDFKHPDKFSKDHIRTLQMLHENLARLWSSSMSAHLRGSVQVEVISIEQVSYEEFLMHLSNPTVMSTISLQPLPSLMVWEINPEMAISMVERLLGGSGETEQFRRELTEIELTVIRNTMAKMTNDIRSAWSNVLSISPELVSIEVNPQFCHIAPPTEMVILVGMEMRLNRKTGLMNICLPYTLLEATLPRLSAQYWFASGEEGTDEFSRKAIKDLLEPTLHTMSVELGEIILQVDELMDLEVGDVIKLPTNVGRDLDVVMDNKVRFKCRPGVVGNRLGVEITRICSNGGETYD